MSSAKGQILGVGETTSLMKRMSIVGEIAESRGTSALIE